MTDKKLTDSEIVKALECCVSNTNIDCDVCPYRASDKSCIDTMLENALDLINRQKAEIERLQKDSKRLKKVQMQLDDMCKMYHTIKAEAYKEFAEKVNEEITEAIFANDRVIQARVEKRNVNRYEDDLCIMCDGKISALGGIKYFINNLLRELEGDK